MKNIGPPLGVGPIILHTLVLNLNRGAPHHKVKSHPKAQDDFLLYIKLLYYLLNYVLDYFLIPFFKMTVFIELILKAKALFELFHKILITSN